MRLLLLLSLPFFALVSGCAVGPSRTTVANNKVLEKAMVDFRCQTVRVTPISQLGFDAKQYKFWAEGCGYRAKYIIMCSSWSNHCEMPAILGSLYRVGHARVATPAPAPRRTSSDNNEGW